MAGVFTSVERGRYDRVRYVGTVGVAHTRRNWLAERQFAFLENGLFAGSHLSVYHSMEVDHQSKGRFESPTGGPVLTRSFLTVRAAATDWLSFDLSHNYFRTVPTFDTRLIGIGIADQLLFQGVTGGFRLGLPWRSALNGLLSYHCGQTPVWLSR